MEQFLHIKQSLPTKKLERAYYSIEYFDKES